LGDIGLKQREQERRGRLGHGASQLQGLGKKRKGRVEGRKPVRWRRSRLWTSNSINAKNRVER
jgi:hypothetical protein